MHPSHTYTAALIGPHQHQTISTGNYNCQQFGFEAALRLCVSNYYLFISSDRTTSHNRGQWDTPLYIQPATTYIRTHPSNALIGALLRPKAWQPYKHLKAYDAEERMCIPTHSVLGRTIWS
jgi:hypothetical protein